MMLSPGYGCRTGGRHSASTPLGTQWTGTLGYFAESTAASWGVLAMTPSAARTVSRSSRGTRTPNSRVWTTGWDSQAFEWGPAHGSRRSMSQRTGCPIVASRATRWAEWGGPLLTTTCGWKRRTSARALRTELAAFLAFPAPTLVWERQERRELRAERAEE